jgi:hypothetical protein
MHVDVCADGPCIGASSPIRNPNRRWSLSIPEALEPADAARILLVSLQKPRQEADIMNMRVRHFIFTNDGRMEEFTEQDASSVAVGSMPLPEFADSSVRYIQVAYDNEREQGQIRVRTSGAIVSFDDDGHLCRAQTPDKSGETISRFEHDACVQFALKDELREHYREN